ncbi:MAG: pirin family protein [bacterium]|nr:pirin family protein [bacterium]
MRIIKAKNRHYTDLEWLRTYWLFSFDTYHDPENMNFGNLRVFNDDIVAAKTGFPPHPHANMEIVTVVLEGELAHEDNAGNKGIVRPGDVQHMSAGKGVVHSEFNHGKTSVHLYQIWLGPRKQQITPAYHQQTFLPSKEESGLLPVASGESLPGAIPITADATVYLGTLKKAGLATFNVRPSHGAFVYVTQGTLEIHGSELLPGDQARISEEGMLNIKAKEASRFILIEVDLTS